MQSTPNANHLHSTNNSTSVPFILSENNVNGSKLNFDTIIANSVNRVSLKS